MDLKNIKQKIKLGIFYKDSAYRYTRFMVAKVLYRISKQPKFSHPNTIGIITVIPGEEHPIIKLPKNYHEIVDSIVKSGDEILRDAKKCLYIAEKEIMGQLLEKSNQVTLRSELPSEITEKIVAVRTKKAEEVKGLEEFCQSIIPQVEEHIFGSYVEINSPFLEYKFAGAKMEEKDEKFHSDRHYEDTVRLIVYLNDVDEGSAPFEYIRHKVTGEVPRIPVSEHPTKTDRTRVKKEIIDEYLNSGYERVKVVGKKGTFIIFDSKIIHKANKAKTGDRKVVVLPIRPATAKHERYIDDSRVDNAYI